MSAALRGPRATVSLFPSVRFLSSSFLSSSLHSPLPLSHISHRRGQLLRHAHSTCKHDHEHDTHTAQSSSLTVPTNKSTAKISLEYGVNPPLTTRPPVLNLPEKLPRPSPTTAKLKRFIAIGRAYASFYKTGLKNVYHNYRASLPIRRALGISAFLPSSPPPTPSNSAAATEKTLAFRQAIHTYNLSRSHFQLVCRAAGDARRMIPFTLLLILADELTPILLPIIGNAIIPLACWTPGQIVKERKLKRTRKHGAIAARQAEHQGSAPSFSAGSDEELHLLAHKYANAEWTDVASREEVLRACAVFNLVKAHDRFGRLPLVSSVYRPRLRRHVEYLSLDDALIRTSGGVAAMDAVEVRISVEERGGVDVAEGKEEEEIEETERQWLERWLNSRKDAS